MEYQETPCSVTADLDRYMASEIDMDKLYEAHKSEVLDALKEHLDTPDGWGLLEEHHIDAFALIVDTPRFFEAAMNADAAEIGALLQDSMDAQRKEFLASRCADEWMRAWVMENKA